MITFRKELRRLLSCSIDLPPAPPPVSVVSPAQDLSEEEDSTSEYDTDLQTDVDTKCHQRPEMPERKLSFYMDFDPITTPPASPRAEKKISVISWSRTSIKT